MRSISFWVSVFRVPSGISSSTGARSSILSEYEPDRLSAALAEAGPISSYNTLEDSMIVSSMGPPLAPRVLAPRAARPIATPAWGISARPRYLVTFLALPVARQPRYAPRYLPSILTIKYSTPMVSRDVAPMPSPRDTSTLRSKFTPLRTKNSSSSGGDQ